MSDGLIDVEVSDVDETPPEEGLVPEEEVPGDVVPEPDPLVEAVKARLSITGSHHDTLIKSLADDVKAFMVSAGVSPAVAEHPMSYGAIARGVSDLWGMGGVFSDMFRQRVIQLTFETVPEIVEPEEELPPEQGQETEVEEDELQP